MVPCKNFSLHIIIVDFTTVECSMTGASNIVHQFVRSHVVLTAEAICYHIMPPK